MSDHLVVAGLTLLWCIFHSGAIDPRIERRLSRALGSRRRFMRLGYNVVSLVGLAAVLAFAETRSATVIFHWRGPAALFRAGGLVLALAVALLGARRYDNREFLGLRQVRERSRARSVSLPAEGRATFSRSGIHRVIRHPYYLSAILVLVFMLDVTDVNVIWRGLLLVYTVAGTFLEERKLIAGFGAGYLDYRRRTSMYVPWKWFRRAVTGRR